MYIYMCFSTTHAKNGYKYPTMSPLIFGYGCVCELGMPPKMVISTGDMIMQWI